MKKKWPTKRILKWFVILFLLTLPFWILLLVPTLYFYNAAFGEGAYCATRKKEGFIAKTTCGLSHTYDEYAPYFRFLPSDKKMIENFYKHRADFEQLAKTYREDCKLIRLPSASGTKTVSKTGRKYPKPVRLFSVQTNPEFETILKRTNTVAVYPDGILWIPPDPYSKEAREIQLKYNKLSRLSLCERRSLSGVIFHYSHWKVRRIYPNDFDFVSKDYYYTPFVPKIEAGQIRLAQFGRMKILPNLNRYPSDSDWGLCVVRQIEPQWFIMMCHQYL